MPAFLSPVVLAFGLTITLVAAAGAQAIQACEVNEGRPTQIARATLDIQMASGTQDPATAARRLASAVKLLTENGEKMDNQTGRNFVLGKALVLWSMQPNVSLTTARGPLGYTTNPTGMIDLATAIDSAFKVVEAAHPECVAETTRWRGQKAWVDLVNKAIERMNAEDADSAQAVAQRAITLNPYAPYGYVVLANVMQKRGKTTEAIRLYRQSVDMAARDTSYNEIRRQSLVYLGNLATDSAEVAADAAARKPYMDVARAAFEELMRDKDAGDFNSNARAGLCRLAIASGDTSQLRTTYKDPLATPASFSYSDLMIAGVCMARAEMVPEATTLFQGAYEKNPYHRDALSNLAIMLLRKDDFERSIPLATRLVEVEPNNPENLQLLVLAYAGIAKRASDARRAGTRTAPATKTGARPAARPATPRMSAASADSLFKVEQAYTDSAVKANARKVALEVKVQLSDFSTTSDKSTLSGFASLTGVLKCESGSWDDEVKRCRLPDGKFTDGKSVEGTYFITVDFLDAAGTVVASEKTDVVSLRGQNPARFSVTTTTSGIKAFRYRVTRVS